MDVVNKDVTEHTQIEEEELVQVSECQSVVPWKHGEPEIKSDAEVKHGTVHFLAHFSPLQMNTNLNIPPSNWLRSSSELEKHVRDLTWQRKTSEFSSIQMAHNSLDITGEVDVISNAANIKKLLKMPFEKSHVSMMVHRVGKSVLLDEFDIHKHLLRQEKNKWKWLLKFYRDSVLREYQEMHMKGVPRQSKSRDSLQNINMYSKFLYHSVCESPNESFSQDMEVPEKENTQMVGDDQLLWPDPLPQCQPKGSQFQRETLWTFEDIKMLIGTDLPVFRNDSYYVSLRLREMRTPINVLTGLDYWLDNLMCNVPEVAMCYHLNGFVQKYELIKTEDIPHLENSTFDPRKVTDIAKNILSFLKTNATKEGDTYWLYKGVDDDVVKLYDLTTLCDGDVTDQNPFTVPLGMLLYRVARSMWESKEQGKATVIRTLLETCLYLLDENKHSQICTSACYLLSDILVPDSSLQDDWSMPCNGSATDGNADDSTQDWEDLSDDTSNSVNVGLLSKAGSVPRASEKLRLKPFITDPSLRCEEGLKHVAKGLSCLESDLSCHGDGYNHKNTSIVEEQARCNSDEAIPLHYEPIHRTTPDTDHNTNKVSPGGPQKNVSVHGDGNSKRHGRREEQKRKGQKNSDESQDSKVGLQMRTVTGEEVSWHGRSKGLLLKKAALMFIVKVKGLVSENKYVDAFKYLRSAFLCYNALQHLLPGRDEKLASLLGCLYSLAGDIRLFLGKQVDTVTDWGSVWKDLSPDEATVVDIAEGEIRHPEFDLLLKTDCAEDENLVICVTCYRRALELTSKKERLNYDPAAKRLGNALNELGVWYMYHSQSIIQSQDLTDKPTEEIMVLWKQAEDALSEGREIFVGIEDVANQALLHCNQGRLMRLCAQTYAHIALREEGHQFSKKERFYRYFDQALDHYQQALSLGEQGFRSLCEAVTWELSTTYFNMATLLQDYAPVSAVSKQEIEQEVITLMNKSLKYSRWEGVGAASQPMCQFRAATIYHRLASLYHNSLRNCNQEDKRKRLRHLSESHYDKALGLFQGMECHAESLRVKLENLALLDYFLPAQGGGKSRQRQLLQMLHRLADCSESLKGFMGQLKEAGETIHSEGETILKIIESRIQYVLLQLVKSYTSGAGKKSQEKQSLVSALKKLYRESLSALSFGSQPETQHHYAGSSGDSPQHTGPRTDNSKQTSTSGLSSVGSQPGTQHQSAGPSGDCSQHTSIGLSKDDSKQTSTGPSSVGSQPQDLYVRSERLQRLLDQLVWLHERSVSLDHDPS